jgi:hypothetical protein
MNSRAENLVLLNKEDSKNLTNIIQKTEVSDLSNSYHFSKLQDHTQNYIGIDSATVVNILSKGEILQPSLLQENHKKEIWKDNNESPLSSEAYSDIRKKVHFLSNFNSEINSSGHQERCSINVNFCMIADFF